MFKLFDNFYTNIHVINSRYNFIFFAFFYTLRTKRVDKRTFEKSAQTFPQNSQKTQFH